MTASLSADRQSLLEACHQLERTVHDRTADLARARVQIDELRESAVSASHAKQQFLATMSHELRTPMNGVLGMAELLNETALTGEQREYIDVLTASARSLLRVVDEILDFSDIEAGRFELESQPFHLHRCLGDLLRQLAPAARAKGLEFVGYVDPRLPGVVSGDLARLRQVVSSLVDNAIAFTTVGEVTVDVRESSMPVAAGRRLLHVIVRDTGVGIPPPMQPAMVAPVASAEAPAPRCGGTGLGLAMSRRIVAMMGGRLWLDSVPGQGSVFHFTCLVEVPADAPALADAYQPRLAGRRVLIVDDHRGARQALGMTLDACGVSTTLVARSELLAAAASASRPIDAVILDLPEADSELPALVAALQRAASTAPVVIVGSPRDAVRCGNVPAATFLASPIPAPVLLDAVTTATAAAPARGRPSGWRARGERFRGLTVLVAEDNPINQQVITLMLQGWGITVTVAPSGRDVLAALARATFDAVLMDVQMPDGDGCQTTTAIRAREAGTTHRMPIIALTAQREDRARCLAAGMDDYLSKPVVPAELADMLDRATPPRSEHA